MLDEGDRLTSQEIAKLSKDFTNKKSVEVFLARKGKRVENSVVSQSLSWVAANDELMSLTKLFVDDANKEIYFSLVFRNQSHLHIGKVSFAEPTLKLSLSHHLIVSPPPGGDEEITQLQQKWRDEREMRIKRKEYEKEQQRIIKEDIMDKIKLTLHRVMSKQESVVDNSQVVDFRCMVDYEHLAVFGCRNTPASDFFIYVFSNKKESSNKQS